MRVANSIGEVTAKERPSTLKQDNTTAMRCALANPGASWTMNDS